MNYALSSFASAQNPALTFVVPVKDEQATLDSLFKGIAREAMKITDTWEVIFIDDGSTDRSWTVIEELSKQNPQHVRALRFRHNAGKAAALAAGWQAARGEIIFTMDADLQDDPQEIPRFLEKIDEGYDIVTGWKRERHDPWHKVIPSRIFNLLLSWVNKVSLHDHNCGFKCYRREVIESLPMYGEMHRMVPSLAAMHGFKTAEIPVKHHPRQYGKSKYGLKRFVRGYLDMWTVFFLQNFRQRPMHLMGTVSLAMLCFGGVLALLLSRVSLPFSAFLLLSSALPGLLIGAVLTAMIGFLAEWNVHNQRVDNQDSPRDQPISQAIGIAISSLSKRLSAGQMNGETVAAQGMTALLLDDNPIARDLNAAYFEQAGWTVITADSCEEARAKLTGEIDIILLDPCLRDGLSMVEFVRFVQKNSALTPQIVFLPTAEPGVRSVAASAMRRSLVNQLKAKKELSGEARFQNMEILAAKNA